MATFATRTGGKLLAGYYSFIEDFRRNRVSTTQPRRASYGNGWVQGCDGKWLALTEARFTADSNRATNINAGSREGAFFLATGGNITNSEVRLGQNCKRARLPKEPPILDNFLEP